MPRPTKPKPEPPKAKPAGPSKPADPVVANSVRELAGLLVRSHTAVNRWLKDARWTFGQGPTWRASDVSAIKDWAARELAEAPSPGGNGGATGEADGGGGGDPAKLSLKTKADVQLKISRNKLLVLEYEARAGKVHPVDQCRRDRLRAIQEVRQGLVILADSLPVDADTKTIVRGRCLELLRRFALGMGVAADPNAAVMDALGTAVAVPAGGG